MKKIISVSVLVILLASLNVMAFDASTLKGLKGRKAEFEGQTWMFYKSKKTPSKNFYPIRDMQDYDNTMFYAYIRTLEDKAAYFRLYVQVEPTEGFIMFNKIIVQADDQSLERIFDETKLSVSKGPRRQTIEMYDVEVSPHDIKIMEAIIAAKKSTITFIGKNGKRESKISKKQKKAFQDILTGWDKLVKSTQK